MKEFAPMLVPLSIVFVMLGLFILYIWISEGW